MVLDKAYRYWTVLPTNLKFTFLTLADAYPGTILISNPFRYTDLYRYSDLKGVQTLPHFRVTVSSFFSVVRTYVPPCYVYYRRPACMYVLSYSTCEGSRCHKKVGKKDSEKTFKFQLKIFQFVYNHALAVPSLLHLHAYCYYILHVSTVHGHVSFIYCTCTQRYRPGGTYGHRIYTL